jgi:hypothetical protein
VLNDIHWEFFDAMREPTYEINDVLQKFIEPYLPTLTIQRKAHADMRKSMNGFIQKVNYLRLG